MKSHLKGRTTQRHNTILLTQKSLLQPLLCMEHKQQLRYYCTKDGELLCSECGFTHHSGHICKPVNEAYENEKCKICELGEESRKEAKNCRDIEQRFEVARREIESAGLDAKAEVAASFERIRALLASREKETLHEIDTEIQSKLEILDHQTQQINYKIGRAVQQECRDRSRMPSSA
eukprot:TRINITY_DN9538_c0_g3_i1.p1 TRINITY_DN9538_c0_g3~~TRINITY_DN9538_c0_g3_i1.p1  ORF type:complete len:193 (-),score=24.35 TRINITY_DN9538_c0_g3_i1:19-549(-)